MKVRLLDGWEQVGKSAWDQLWAASSVTGLFLTWQWMTAWWATFGQSAHLRLLGVEDDEGGLVGLLPLFSTGQGEPLSVVGGVEISDYLDLVVLRGHEHAAWSALVQHLAAERARLDLHCLPAGSSTLRVLPELARAAGFSVSVELEERCPIIDLPDSWDTYLDRLTGKARHEILRKRRRLERLLPDITVRVHRTTERLDEQMTAFLALHRKSRRKKTQFMDASMEQFFRTIAREFASVGWLRLWFLEARAEPLAALLCFDDGVTVSLYNSGYDPERSAFAPGIVLTSYAISGAIGEGRRRFDFLRGEEPYKYAFGATPEDVMRITIAPRAMGEPEREL